MSTYDEEFDDIYSDDEENEDSQFLIFSAAENKYAVPALEVREMLPPQKVVQIPGAPPWVRGVINVRAETFTLIDFRSRIGGQSINEVNAELLRQLEVREREHVHWLDQLEAAVAEDAPFEGEIDPHRCKFGQWYDNYVSDNAAINLQLKKFDQPHRTIHETARHALELKDSGKQQAAVDLINARRNNELDRMRNLFHTLKEQIKTSYKEVVVLIENSEQHYAIAVDRVESVETLETEDEVGLHGFQSRQDSFARNAQIATRKGGDEIVYIVDTVWIFSGSESLELPSV
ncbi:MAG: chemotaxis protein CheW [Spirochaetota bacterium]